MPDFTYATYTSYREDAFFGGFSRFQFNSNAGTIEDPSNGLLPRLANDGIFQPTESFTLYPDPMDPSVSVELTYVGTVEVNGETMPVFESIYFGDLYLFSQNTDPLPSSFDETTINDGAEYNFNCFAEGTRIATPLGEVAVEHLAPGDLVLTADGRAVPVVWAWVQTVRRGFEHEHRSPVRIAAGALGGGLPHRDLVVTADHALVLGDLLVNAGALVGADGIAFMERLELPVRYRVYHIETEAHEAILAEGAAAESFIDYVSRQSYDGYDAYIAAHGAERLIPEMTLPRVSSARLLPPALRAKLFARHEGEIRAA